jgi:predicted transcriptional regulator
MMSEQERQTVVPLPTPEEVQATFTRMREAVEAAHAEAEQRVADARAELAAALSQAAAIREQYPMFFPDEQDASQKPVGRASVEQKNAVMRALAEHPDQTRKQLARRISYSPSWAGEIVKQIRQDGDFIKASRRGREIAYSLTELGETTIGHGGFRG